MTLNPYNPLFFFLAVPMMISMLVQIQSVQTKQKIAKIVLFFFVIESILAIYERITNTNTFELNIIDDITSIDFESWSFRSTSFLGHPLNNALCVSIMMGTILVSKINEKYKFIFLIIGFLGILSFNARGATLVMSFIIIYYFYLSYKKYGRQIYYKTLLVLASIIGVSFFYYIITSTSLGGRLMNNDKIIDGSAQARLDVFEAFNYFSGKDFLFGNQSLYVPIMEKLAQGGIENSYIVKITNSSALKDLIDLSKCDYICGPPSSFSAWASLYNDSHLYFIEEIKAEINEISFINIKKVWF